jgi:hypothetical protein
VVIGRFTMADRAVNCSGVSSAWMSAIICSLVGLLVLSVIWDGPCGGGDDAANPSPARLAGDCGYYFESWRTRRLGWFAGVGG